MKVKLTLYINGKKEIKGTLVYGFSQLGFVPIYNNLNKSKIYTQSIKKE